MKLYLPTSTLNFNNLLTTASVYPPAWYPRRDFGVRRFVPVKPNFHKEVLTLFKSFPRYDIEDDGLENYPLVVELELPEGSLPLPLQPSAHCPGEIFYYPGALYLNPQRTAFYFQEERQLKLSLSAASTSLEVKYLQVFKQSLKVGFPPGRATDDFAQARLDKVEQLTERAEVSLALAGAADRLQGAAQAFSIGAFVRDQHKRGSLNTLAALAEGLGYAQVPDTVLKEKVTMLCDKALPLYRALDSRCLAITQHLTKLTATLPALSATALEMSFYSLCAAGVCLPADNMEIPSALTELIRHRQRFCEDKGAAAALARSLITLIKTLPAPEHSSYLPERFFTLQQSSGRPYLKLKSVLEQVSSVQRSFWANLMNKLIFEPFTGEFDGKQLAGYGGALLRDICLKKGLDWQNSPERVFINALLDNLEAGAPLPEVENKHSVLLSFAAFCQQGRELERLTNNLKRLKITDPSVALGFYGARCGLSGLPRTLWEDNQLAEPDFIRQSQQSCAESLVKPLTEFMLHPAVTAEQADANTAAAPRTDRTVRADRATTATCLPGDGQIADPLTASLSLCGEASAEQASSPESAEIAAEGLVPERAEKTDTSAGTNKTDLSTPTREAVTNALLVILTSMLYQKFQGGHSEKFKARLMGIAQNLPPYPKAADIESLLEQQAKHLKNSKLPKLKSLYPRLGKMALVLAGSGETIPDYCNKINEAIKNLPEPERGKSTTGKAASQEKSEFQPLEALRVINNFRELNDSMAKMPSPPEVSEA